MLYIRYSSSRTRTIDLGSMCVYYISDLVKRTNILIDNGLPQKEDASAELSLLIHSSCHGAHSFYAGSYPWGFLVCQFHKSLHIVSRSLGALNPSSFSARTGSAVRSGTSPRLIVLWCCFSGQRKRQQMAVTTYRRPMISYL